MKTTVPKALLLLVVVLSVAAIVSAAPAEEGESLKRSQQDKEHDDLPLDAADVNDDQLIEVNDKRSTVARRERVSKHLKRRRKADTDIDNDDDDVDSNALALLDGTARDGSDDDLSLTQTKSKAGWWWSYRRRRWWSYRRRRWWYRRRRWWYRRRRWWYRRRRWVYRRRRWWVYRRRRWWYRRRRWWYRRRRWWYRRRRWVYRRRRWVYRRRRWWYRRRRWVYRRRRWVYRRRRWWYRRRRWWYRRRRWVYRRRRWVYRRRRWVYRRRRWWSRRRRYVYRRRRYVYRRRRYVYRRRRYVYRRRRYVYRRRRYVYRRRRNITVSRSGKLIKIAQKKHFPPIKGKIIAKGADFPAGDSYTWAFWVKPLTSHSAWSNIIHKGTTDYRRSPAVWFYPGSTRLHIRSSTTSYWNNGHDPTQYLTAKRWTHVAFSHNYYRIRVYINGALVGTTAYNSAVSINTDPLYSSNPWYQPAHCVLSDLRMYTYTMHATAIKSLYSTRLYRVQKKTLAQRVNSNVKIPQPTTYFMPVQSQVRAAASLIPNKHKYTWTVWIKPLSARGTGHGWANLFHKGSTNSERNPAVWFYPGSHRLHIRSGTSATWNDGSDPAKQLPLKKWTHLAFSHGFSSLKVYYNGHMKSTYATTHPLTNNGPLYTSDPWYPAGHALLSQLRMYSIELSAKEVKYVYTNTKKRNYAQAAGKWCGCKNVYRNFNTQQWHNCPSGTLMTGVYRTSTDYLNGIQYYRCCSPCNGNGKKMKVSVCSVANWWSSFDSTGWSKCPKNMYMQGVYKNWCNWIYCLEMARCCYIDGSKGSRSCTTKSSWVSSLDSAGWSYLDKNKFMTGLYRSAQHYLHNIEYASQCAFKAPVKKKVVVTPTAATAVVVTKKGSSKYHKGWLDGWKAGWKDGTINHSQ